MPEERDIQVDSTIDVDLDDVFQILDDIAPTPGERSTGRREIIPKAAQIRVHARDDKLEAYLGIVMPDGPAIPITERLIRQELEKQGITFGIEEPAIRRIIAEAADNGHADGVVARGKEPLHGADASIKWVIPDPSVHEEVFVAPGKVLCQATLPEKGTDGKDVAGAAIPSRPGAEPLLIAGKGVKYDRRNRMWAAEAGGRVVFRDNRLGVEPIRDAEFTIEVDPSGLSAALHITPSIGDGKKILPETVLAEIDRRRIGAVDRDLVRRLVERAVGGASIQGQIIAESPPPQFELVVSEDWMEATLRVVMPDERVSDITLGALRSLAEDAMAETIAPERIDKEALGELLSEARSSRVSEGRIAAGIRPQAGEPARLEWLFQEPLPGRKMLVPGGKQLARYVPPTEGRDGATVSGIAVAAAAGSDIDLLAGQGIRFDRGRGGIWAERSGQFSLDGKTLSVVPYGDASFSIAIDHSGLLAYLTVTPHEGDGKPISEDEVIAEIRRLHLGSVKEADVREQVLAAREGRAVNNCVIAESAPPLPYIEISADRMEAFLRIEMPTDPVRRVSREYLRDLTDEAILASGVQRGINNNAIDALLDEAHRSPSVEGAIAKGMEPVSGEDGAIKWIVTEDLEDDQTIVVVPGGKVVATLIPSGKGTPGETVTGEIIPAKSGLTPQIPYSTGIKFDEARSWWHTTNPGRLRIIDSYLTVKPHENASASVQVEAGKLRATLTIIPKAGDGRNITAEEVVELLKSEKIIGYDEATVRGLVDRSHEGEEVDAAVIALGRPSVPGLDGRVDFLINISAKSRRGIPALRPVKTGDTIARFVPATPGAVGVDVHGAEILPTRTKEPRVDCGAGVEVQGGEVRATESGNVIVKAGLIEVKKILEFSRDVTTAVGNVEFDGHVVIDGNVGDNVTIRSSGDVYVKESVGAAHIVAGGDIEVGAGIVGRDKGMLSAKGSVRAQFVERCSVDAGDSIDIAKAALHSRLFALKGIELLKERGALVGGEAASGNFIRANVIGSESGTETIVSVGRNPFVQRELEDVERQLLELRSALQAVITALKETTDAIEASGSPKLQMTLRELMRKKVLIPYEIRKLFQKRETLTPNLYIEDECAVEVREVAHPGVTLRAGKEQLTVGTPIQFARFTRGPRGVEIGSL